MDADFQSGFGYGMAIGLGLVALWIALMPRRYVACVDHATFRHVRWFLKLRLAFARLTSRPQFDVERDALARLDARIDSAVARRNDPRLDRTARTTGLILVSCCILGVVLPHAVSVFVGCAMLALAFFIVRLEARTPGDGGRRVAALRPRPSFDPVLATSIGAAALLLAGAVALAAFDDSLARRLSLAVAALFGIAILVLALRLARRPAAIAPEDTVLDAYVDEQLRVTRVAYLLLLSLAPSLLAIVQSAHHGDAGAPLRWTYFSGVLVVLAAWIAAGLRMPKTVGEA